ncbi:hypothetical protein lerEdw1_019230, partial [Lerista edwardsae]
MEYPLQLGVWLALSSQLLREASSSSLECRIMLAVKVAHEECLERISLDNQTSVCLFGAAKRVLVMEDGLGTVTGVQEGSSINDELRVTSSLVLSDNQGKETKETEVWKLNFCSSVQFDPENEQNCKVTWDNVTCWPAANLGDVGVIPCPHYFAYFGGNQDDLISRHFSSCHFLRMRFSVRLLHLEMQPDAFFHSLLCSKGNVTRNCTSDGWSSMTPAQYMATCGYDPNSTLLGQEE